MDVRYFQPYATVRIRQLIQPPEAYDGWCMNMRTPVIGDIGCIIDILSAPGLPNKYVVECVAQDGTDIWLGDFFAEELEQVPN